MISADLFVIKLFDKFRISKFEFWLKTYWIHSKPVSVILLNDKFNFLSLPCFND